MSPVHFLLKTFDEIAVGEHFASRGRTVTETDIVNWCALTGDWHLLHTDAHFAAKSRFGQRIAPGFLVYAIGIGLGVPPDARNIVANYGAEHLRFLAPTLIGDTVHLEASVRDKQVKRPAEDGIVNLSWDVVNQNGVKVLTSDLKVLMSCTALR